jgi:hypothetical protein
MLRICGNCTYASEQLEHAEIRFLVKVNFQQGGFLARRRVNSRVKEKKMLCKKENVRVSNLEQACAFWRTR